MGTLELTPYIGATDILSSERLGWGLKKTITIAESVNIYDFCFRKSTPTEVESRMIE
jgi:hypothetical protein